MKPILFNTYMVRAILDGRKTVTRRVVKLPSNIQPQGKGLYTLYAEGTCYELVRIEEIVDYLKPPYKVNDVLYVRETWQSWSCTECDWECVPDNGNGCCTMPKYLYKASDEETDKGWKPSIHMPKEAARLFLRVTDVRVEKLRDMKLEDFLKEGIYIKPSEIVLQGSDQILTGLERVAAKEHRKEAVAREKFKDLWNSTIDKPYSTEQYPNSWYGNPYVWVIEFEVITADQAQGN